MITPDHPLLQLLDLIDQVWIEVLPETVKRGAPRWYSEKTMFKVYIVSLLRALWATTTAHGKFTFHLFAALAEFERDIIRERTKAGLNAARARGRIGGRPKGLSKKAQHTAMIAERLYHQQTLTAKEICEQLSISKATLYNYLRHQGVTFEAKK